MGLFDDLSRFLENRLEEFLRNNPHLELEALLEQLREQEEDTLKLIADLQLQEKRSQDDILATAQEIQRWHIRVQKAKDAGRQDLVTAASEREAALLREGNQRWGHMQGLKERINQSQELLRKIQQRRQEVQAKAAEAQTARAKAQTQQRLETDAWWNQTSSSSSNFDDLEEKFRRWETQDELEQMKRNMGK
ncbi:phage shock protein A (IM30), suppresses sigma54-dependent transcription [Nostoc linckia z18]|uniref:Phage shock protein A (IM30), suppresses sigma54-dependent transcription n=2 Tax=Nostoc linckia TaxID=92942 RepID=A0A9Q5Z999_NOSLI|nr:TIGR04376 family protein [Nostoc linckia]PHK30308.1 phage shock protein A (IM30), suppresses sigma54-dependent transcription [Nostoc linckia z15]PHK44605.1 phage shock protein A (IM30), suppresses sigma54-dependent transcription [Nostoc linckia z16]PHJ65658.1 phage shock protein A (IM30), suppresses sigma54-dependent transcription [Nostoc linckia z1]PHJ70452.1 phage shock protein A (IM30), suppresses sigma54-dependent transcription [Nostoc linckia z3]PHJ75519.1 phage shock protein A (IM30),